MARAGGRYRADKDGNNATLVREPTKNHPKGNRARDKDGKPLNEPDDKEKPKPQQAEAPQNSINNGLAAKEKGVNHVS